MRGRFSTAYRDDELVWLLAQAQALSAPAPLTQRRFDALRHELGHPGAPSGAQIARRLRLEWREAVARAGRSSETLSRSLYKRAAFPTLGGDMVARARWAIRVAALRLDSGSISAVEYDRVRADLIRQAPRGLTPGLPNATQLTYMTGRSWREVKALADQRPKKSGRRPGLSLVDAIELCLHAHGALPTQNELFAFANANAIPLTRRQRKHLAAIEDLRERRAAQGRWTPARTPPPSQRPNYARPLDIGPSRRLGRQKWTREDCIAALCEFLRWLSAHDPRATPTEKRYIAWSSSRPDRPWSKTIISHGGWNFLLDQARHRLMTGERGVSESDRPLERLLENSRKPELELAIIDYASKRRSFTVADIGRDLGVSTAASYDRLRRLHDAGIIKLCEPDGTGRCGHPANHYRLAPLTEDLERLRRLFGRRQTTPP